MQDKCPASVFSHTPVNFDFGGVFDALCVLLTDHLLVTWGCAEGCGIISLGVLCPVLSLSARTQELSDLTQLPGPEEEQLQKKKKICLECQTSKNLPVNRLSVSKKMVHLKIIYVLFQLKMV